MHEDITRSIKILTARTVAYRRFLIMDRLTEKLQRAAAVAPRQAAKIEARADQLIAREAAIEAKTDARFNPLESLLDSAESGMDALDSAFRGMSNGGPPLQDSGNSESGLTQTGGSGASTEPSQTSDAEKPHG